MDVGKRLGLDTLRGVDDEDRALARLEAAAHLVAEVDMARRVDEVEPVDETVMGARVLEPHRAGLDRDALLALEVHRVEDLAHHLTALDRVRQLEQPIGERRFAVIDVRDDREVAESVLRDGHEFLGAWLRPGDGHGTAPSVAGHSERPAQACRRPAQACR